MVRRLSNPHKMRIFPLTTRPQPSNESRTRSVRLTTSLSIGPIDNVRLPRQKKKIRIEKEKFLESFGELSLSVIKPTMEVIVRRLEEDGGGGLIWDGDSEAMHRPRLILWMSLKGKITGTPGQDLNPYLQLDVDVEHRRIDVWEGDMWEREGTSRATSPWTLDEITSETVTERVVSILERAADHGQTFNPAPPK